MLCPSLDYPCRILGKDFQMGSKVIASFLRLRETDRPKVIQLALCLTRTHGLPISHLVPYLLYITCLLLTSNANKTLVPFFCFRVYCSEKNCTVQENEWTLIFDELSPYFTCSYKKMLYSKAVLFIVSSIRTTNLFCKILFFWCLQRY